LSVLLRVVCPTQLSGESQWGLEKKTTKGLRIGEMRQTGQELERAVATQQGLGCDAIQTQDERPRQGQHHLGERVLRVPAFPVDVASQEMADLQHSNKFVQEERASIVH